MKITASAAEEFIDELPDSGDFNMRQLRNRRSFWTLFYQIINANRNVSVQPDPEG